jgi:hypothetical protein
VLDEELGAFLEGGCALLIGTVTPTGRPTASRAWGCTVIDAGRGRMRVVVDSHDATTMGNLASRGRVAVTAADVPTLRSVQLKGRCIGVEPAIPDDLDTAAAYCAKYYGDVALVDGFPLSLCERFTPAGYAACVVDVEELFDQTPGPSAGRPLGGSRG